MARWLFLLCATLVAAACDRPTSAPHDGTTTGAQEAEPSAARQPSAQTKHETTHRVDFEMSVAQFTAEYGANHVSANARYKGRVVALTGPAGPMRDDWQGASSVGPDGHAIYLEPLGHSWWGGDLVVVQCFPTLGDQLQSIADHKRGQVVRMVGKVDPAINRFDDGRIRPRLALVDCTFGPSGAR